MSKILIYIIFVFYFFVDNLTYLVSDDLERYILLVSLGIFTLFGLTQQKLKIFSTDKAFIWLFMFFMIFSGASHMSVDVFLNGVLLAVPFLILENEVKINIKLINALFLVQIGFSILTYYQGANIYGFFPGQASGFMDWRISLFGHETPPYTAFIASVVLLINLFNNESKRKWMFIILCAYWVAFSGSRTMYVFWIVFLFFRIFYKNERKLLMSYLPYIVLALVLLGAAFMEFLIKHLGNIDLFAFLFRTQEYSGRQEMDMSRLNLYEYFYGIFIDNPVFGMGLTGEFTLNGHVMRGSEVWFISLFASIGIGAILWNVYLIKKLKLLLQRTNKFHYWGLVLFIISFMLYSSYLKPYNYGTILLLALVLSKKGMGNQVNPSF